MSDDSVEIQPLLRLIDELTEKLERKYARYSSYAPDAVQIALVKLSLQSPKPDHPEAWLSRVATNAMLDHIRATDRSPVTFAPDDLPDGAVPAPTLAHTTTRTLNAELVKSVMDQMPERDRAMLQAMYIDGVSARTLADQHGLKESGMGRTMDRAREKFRERFRAALESYRLKRRPDH